MPKRVPIMLARPVEEIRRRGPLFLWLGRKDERIALAAAGFRRARSFGLGDVSRVDRNNAGATPMRRHHHPIGLIVAHAEFSLEHRDDELPWRVVVVHKDDLVKAWSLRLWQDFDAWLGDDLSHRIIRVRLTVSCGAKNIIRRSAE